MVTDAFMGFPMLVEAWGQRPCTLGLVGSLQCEVRDNFYVGNFTKAGRASINSGTSHWIVTFLKSFGGVRVCAPLKNVVVCCF